MFIEAKYIIQDIQYLNVIIMILIFKIIKKNSTRMFNFKIR